MLKQILSDFALFLIGLTLLIMTGCTPASKGLPCDIYHPDDTGKIDTFPNDIIHRSLKTEDASVDNDNDNDEGGVDVGDSSSNDKDD